MRELEYTGYLYEKDFLINADKDFRIYIDRCKLDRLPFHDHDHTEIKIILDGECIQTTASSRRKVSTGDVIICTPEMAHGFEEFLDVNHCVIGFNADEYFGAASWLKQLAGFQALFVIEPSLRDTRDIVSNLSLDSGELAIIEKLAQQMIVEFNQKQTGFEIVLRGLLHQLVVQLCRFYTYQLRKSSDNHPVNPLYRVIEHINNNLEEKITIRELSEIYGSTDEHFIRSFKSVYKSTPIEYINQLRTSKAADQLVNTPLSVTHIAYDLGFSDSNYFSRCFKKHMGVSPVMYRKLARHRNSMATS